MNKQTILLIDDQIYNLQFAKEILESSQINIIYANNGKSGIKKALEIIPDLILLDIMMPAMNGFDVCKFFKNNFHTKEIPVIFLSALVDKKDIINGFKYGAVDYITKPFNKEELQARVNVQLKLQKTEKKLKEGQKYFNLLTKHSTDHIWMRDLNLKVMYVSPTYEKFIGYTKQEIIEKHWTHFHPEESIKIIKNEFVRAIKNIDKVTQKTFEAEYIHKDGTIIPAEIKAYTIFNDSGKPIAIGGISRNITERKKIEKILLKARNQLTNAHHIAKLGSWSLNLKTQIITLSSEHQKMINQNEYQVSMPLFEYAEKYILPEDIPIIEQRLNYADSNIKNKNYKDKFEYRVKLQNNEIKYLEVNGSFKAEGIIFGITQDITETKIKSIKLRKSEEKYRLLTATMKDVVVSISPTATLLYVSPSVTKFSGYLPSEVIGTHIAKYFAKKIDLARGLKLIAKILITKKGGRFEFLFNPKNKKPFPVEQTYMPIIKSGKVSSIQVVLRDITERKKHEDKLEELVALRTKELQKSMTNFKNIFEASSDAIFITNLSGDFIEVNEIVAKRIGFSKNEILKKNVIKFHKKQGMKPISNYFAQIIKTGKQVFVTNYTNINGKNIDIELNGTLVKHKNKDAILHISRDITVRREQEKQRLRLIIKTEEKERKRFAKDIHDGLGATLSAAKMYLNIIKRVEPGSQKADEMLVQALKLINMATENTKEIALNIRPHDLSNFGLAVSLQNFCERLNTISSINIQLIVNNFEKRLDENIEINLYRSINELINNTLKYAEAKNIRIDLRQEKNKTIIKYSDDGIGFDYKKVLSNKKHGTGLTNIKNRAKLIGGKANIFSKVGNGMNVKITVDFKN